MVPLQMARRPWAEDTPGEEAAVASSMAAGPPSDRVKPSKRVERICGRRGASLVSSRRVYRGSREKTNIAARGCGTRGSGCLVISHSPRRIEMIFIAYGARERGRDGESDSEDRVAR